MKNYETKSEILLDQWLMIRSITNNWDKYDETNVKIKFNSDNDVPLKRALEDNNSC